MTRRLRFLFLCALLPLGAWAGVPGDSLYNLKATWTTQSGQQVSLAHFQGHPVLFAMVYTSCQASCPLIVSDMQAIEKRLTPALREQVRFLLVSFDPARDTPERLRAFAEKRALDLTRWTLLTGDARDVRELAAAIGLRFKPTGTGDFLHGNIISVLDRDGVVRHQQKGLQQKPDETAQALGDVK